MQAIPSRAAYLAALSASHSISATLGILTSDGALVTSLKPSMRTGQVNVDADAEVTRSATIEFSDPTGNLQFDTDSASSGAVYFDNMVQLVQTTYVPELEDSISVPVFTGPITKFDRTGDNISIEAQGKESYALTGVPSLTLPRGQNAITAITNILRQRCGESRFAFPTTRTRLPKALTVSWEDEVRPWLVCKRIANTLGLQLFYDGAGICRLRTLPSSPVHTFKTGPGGNILTPIAITHDKSVLRNQVHVVGKKPAHQGTANLPDSHPASSWSLRRGNVRTYLREAISEDSIGSAAAARARANARLDAWKRLTFGTTFTALPVPILEELDLVSIQSDAYKGSELMRQFSFAVTGGDMTVGYTDNITIPSGYKRKP